MIHLLIVEDEESIAAGLRDDLEVEGYRVDIATDGDDALARAVDSDYDLILLDLMLPGKDGIAICRELRRRGDRTPIIMLTARSTEGDKIAGLDCGADDYVTKPFSPVELRARIRAALRRREGKTAQVIRFGDYEIDLVGIELRRDGELVRLTPLEFKILSVLVQQGGRALSRHELIDQVWGSDEYVADRTVDAHVAYLRKKIEPEPGAPRYISSVRGIGYRFDG
jgi:two-component system alkaline phosphatase synthesis response regulator PhoP